MLPGKVQAHTSQRRCCCFGRSLIQHPQDQTASQLDGWEEKLGSGTSPPSPKFPWPKPSNNYPKRLWIERWVYIWSWLYLKFHNITGLICSMNILQSNQCWYFSFEISYLCLKHHSVYDSRDKGVSLRISFIEAYDPQSYTYNVTPQKRRRRRYTYNAYMPVQVLDFAAFSEPEYDLPIFCANAFTTPAQSIVVL